jgi:hypothetical protein
VNPHPPADVEYHTQPTRMRGEIIQIVSQRVKQFKLLRNEDTSEWVSGGPGIVIYLSFVHTGPEDTSTGLIDPNRIQKSLKSIPNSGWKSDHSDADSITGLLAAGAEQTLVIIPQATLSGRVKPGDKYLKYHRQIPKERSLELYKNFIIEATQSTVNTDAECEVTRPDRLRVVWGTYGGRQGWEMVSTGPATHYLEF